MAASLGYFLSQMQLWTSPRLEEISGGAAQGLAQSVLRAMILPKLAGVLAITMTLALAVATAPALLSRGSMAEIAEEKSPAVPALIKDTEADKPQVRTDALGDRLPVGALARLGSARFRHGGYISFVAFTPDGKRLISKGIEGVRVWESSTGKELWHLPLKPNGERGLVDLSPDGHQYMGHGHRQEGARTGVSVAEVFSRLRCSLLRSDIRSGRKNARHHGAGFVPPLLGSGYGKGIAPLAHRWRP